MYKASVLLILSLSAVALAGPAFNKDNQIDSQESYLKQQHQQQQTGYLSTAKEAKGPVVDILKQWCFSSQMSQQELTSSFKKLVAAIKSSPVERGTEQAIMEERICSGAMVATTTTGGKTDSVVGQTQADAKAHELIKDVYMDSLIACKSRQCTQQLLKLIEQQSDKIDTIRASYYMTRLAVTEKEQLKNTDEIKQLAESLIQQRPSEQQSESVERQKLFAVTSLVGKYCQEQPADQEAKQIAEQVAKTIVERYLKPVSQQQLQQYQQQQVGQTTTTTTTTSDEQLIKKIAKRSAAIKALANLPGHLIKEIPQVEQEIMSIVQNKQELITVRQSAIECLEQNDKAQQMLKQLTFDQEEPIEIRVAAYRALLTVAYSVDMKKDEQEKQQIASQIIDQVVKHCENKRNQEEDDQFVLYAISHLDNMRTSEQPENQAIKECIMKNKQHYMQIQVLCKKFKQQLADVRRSSRNYKLEQEFNQIESGLVLEGDLIYESKNSQYSSSAQRPIQVLPKLVRVNMSMPVMGKTVNVVEITVRQNQMDEQIMSALKMVESAKFSTQQVARVVDQFKSSVEKQQQQQQARGEQQQQVAECDLTIKIDGCTIIYLSADDFKTTTTTTNQQQQHQRNTRSLHGRVSIVDEIVEYLKRSPVNFNRGINFNINERIAKLLDVEANIIAGLRFESRAQGHSGDDFEIVARMEPRFNFEAIVGPAKVSSKKLLQRFSTKSAVGLRLRFKRQELIDVQLELPMQSMDLFTIESQIVERSRTNTNSYNYLPESIYGQEDIYTDMSYANNVFASNKLISKRSIFESSKQGTIGKLFKGKRVQRSLETPASFARATGLRAKLQYVIAPKDMSLVVACKLDKYEPSMQGYRVQVQKVEQGPAQKSYQIVLSTPGSRTERQVQVQLTKQQANKRTLIKADLQVAQKFDGMLMTEIVHDGRQYSIKSELVSRSPRSQWRHSIEAGVLVSGSAKSPAGRLAQLAYKPYLQLESSSLKRPIQLQGTIAYSQSPKSVISYELKCATTGDYLQGKIILQQRDVRANKQFGSSTKSPIMTSYRLRRSMQSPIELALSKDLTFSHELVCQLQQHAVKVHNMVDWDAQKISLQADSSVTYKNMRKQQQQPDTFQVQLKLDAEQQSVTVERKSFESKRNNDFRATVKSEWRAPANHQMMAELRYQGQRSSDAVVVYKHKIDIVELGKKQHEAQMQVELVSSEQQLNEKYQGRVRLSTERRQKQLELELSSARQQVCKVSVDFESLRQHQLQVYVQGETFVHKCELRNNQRSGQFHVSSRTDKRGQSVAKLMVEINKQLDSCKLVAELPTEQLAMAAELKLASGQRSSLVLKSARFNSQAEFSFETIARPLLKGTNSINKYLPSYLFNKSANLRFRNQFKDLASKQAYWIDTALHGADLDKQSYLRFESPIYRADIEFEPHQQLAKIGAFARSKRSAVFSKFDDDEQQFNNIDDTTTTTSNNIYSNIFAKNSPLANLVYSHQSPLSELANKLKLGQDKVWMMRAIMSSPFGREQLKQQARRALFQYADRVAQHKHLAEWSPMQQQLQFDLHRKPNVEFQPMDSFEPLSLRGQLSQQRPSLIKLESEWMNADVDMKPFDQEESYAKLSVLSRQPRSAFKKHESEWRHKRGEGHSAWMKHVDSDDKRHELRAQTERDPKKWAKLEFESDKHGKANWEHKWRKHQQKRSSSSFAEPHAELEDVYANQIAFRAEAPMKENKNQRWMQQTKFEWSEPIKMLQRINEARRYRRSILSSIYASNDEVEQQQQPATDNYFKRFYGPSEYLKHTSARLSSSYAVSPITGKLDASEPLYKVDFDYKPQLRSARLDVSMPEELVHSSSFEMQPSERLYKLQSKLYNRRTQENTYDFSAMTKPYVASLATKQQEPVFINSEHPQLERPITKSLAYNLFKQPVKLDYSDKYGRVASFDYDQLPMVVSQKYAGLRQKRAAIYYKDSDNDFEHSSSVDFYPETLIGSMKPIVHKNKNYDDNEYISAKLSGINFDDVVIKSQTKYGPVVVRADTSDADNMQCELESPILSAKLSCESGSNMRKLIKVHLDNKQQRVQLAKLLRKCPESVRELKVLNKLARKIDSSRFEHDTELMVSLVEAIFKLKSKTDNESRPILIIDGEWNQQQGKAYAKLNGERVNGQAAIDLIRKSAELVLEATNKRQEPIQHTTRLLRTSDNFYTLDSTTSIKSRPVVKLVGKISAMVFEQPEHLLARRSRGRHNNFEAGQHVSTFEAIVYEPKQYQITGMFDCEAKEARIVSKSLEENKVQQTIVRFDDNTHTLLVDSRLVDNSTNDQTVYAAKAKLNLPGLFTAQKCYHMQASPSSCASELVYQDQSGFYTAKYQPSQFVSVTTPTGGKQTIKLNYN